MSGGRAWWCLIGGVAAWEIYALRTDPERLLSRALDRGRATHPVANVAVLAAIAATSLHLARVVPSRFDVFALLHIA
ncbi:DUF7427 family protein [Gordonia sp. MMO-8]|uniref:DUF7427 family protein n=1 Tax=Gordonia sp. MMO-8 TaxID=3127886 RepID=UPI0030166DC7